MSDEYDTLEDLFEQAQLSLSQLDVATQTDLRRWREETEKLIDHARDLMTTGDYNKLRHHVTDLEKKALKYFQLKEGGTELQRLHAEEALHQEEQELGMLITKMKERSE